jgi:hypothetical protein
MKQCRLEDDVSTELLVEPQHTREIGVCNLGETWADLCGDNRQVEKACRQIVGISASLSWINFAIKVWMSILTRLSVPIKLFNVDIVPGGRIIQFKNSVSIDYSRALSSISAVFESIAFLIKVS